MPMLKSIAGTTTCSRAVQDYLEHGNRRDRGVTRYLTHDGRALKTDFFNIAEGDRAHWARTMDATRRLAGNDRGRAGRRARMYNHFIISPDPRDGLDVDAVSELARAWVRENGLDEYEVAIVYHDDNASRIVHAHVIVNNTNLVTGKRLHLGRADNINLANSLQRLAERRGVGHFDNTYDAARELWPQAVEHVKEAMHWEERARDDRIRYGTDAEGLAARRKQQDELLLELAREKLGAWQKRTREIAPGAEVEADRITETEKRLAETGRRSWKQDLRDWCLIAGMTCDGTAKGYVDRLRSFGVGVRVVGSGASRDFMYTHPDAAGGGMSGRTCRGRRLGEAYTLRGSERRVRMERARTAVAAGVPDSRLRALVADATVIELSSGIGIAEINRAREDAGLGLAQVVSALTVASDLSIDSITNFDAIIRLATAGGGDAPKLQAARDVLARGRLVPMRPQRPPGPLAYQWKIDKGARLTKAEWEEVRRYPALAKEWNENRRHLHGGARLPEEDRRPGRGGSGGSGRTMAKNRERGSR